MKTKILLMIVCFLIFVTSLHAVEYTIIDLGASVYAQEINNLGQVVGFADIDSERQAFFWENGVLTGLGTFGDRDSYAYGINDLGQVAGFSSNLSVNNAFLWQNGNTTDLYSGRAYSINASGQIVGDSSALSSSCHAVLWHNGILTDLGALGADYSRAYDINSIGQVVGRSTTPFADHAFLWENDQMIDLGTPGNISVARAINDCGQVVGTINGFEAFLWENGVINSISGTPDEPSCAYDINNSGQVVGWSESQTGNNAFLYENNTIYNLNELLPDGSGWSLWNATGINDSGQIVGYGSIQGKGHAFLMTPIPEPSALLLLGLGGLILRKRVNG